MANRERPRSPRRWAAPVVGLILLTAACGSTADSGVENVSGGSGTATTSIASTTVGPGTGTDLTPTTGPDAADTGDGGDNGVDRSAPGPVAGPVVIVTPDGESLTAEVFAPEGVTRGGVVLAHMRGANKETWFEFARTLAAEGYTAVAFDFRGYGGSSGERDTDLDVDITAVVDFLRSAGMDRVFVMGASMGGTATIFEGSQLDLAGVVSLSGPSSFAGLDALSAAAAIDEPALFVAAESDSPYADHAREMAEAAGAEVVILSGHSHGTNLFGDHGPELTDLLLDFLATNA